MAAFDELYDAAKRGWLILVDGGMCRFRIRRDRVLVIYEIIVLPRCQGLGVGRQILRELIKLKPSHIEAKCPSDLRANSWYPVMGFKKVSTEQGKRREMTLWRLRCRK